MTTYRESRNTAAMRAGQYDYDNACPPDDPPEPSEENYAEARRRLLREYDEENLLERDVERLANEIAMGDA